MSRAHTDSSYARELGDINERLLLMGAKVEDMVSASIRSFVERDSSLAREVIEADRDIDSLEVDIDERCCACSRSASPSRRTSASSPRR